MPKYSYKGKDLENKIVSGEIISGNPKSAFEEIKKLGVFAYDIKEIKEKEPKKIKLRAKELSEFCKQLGTMLSAGVPITRSLEILSKNVKNKKQKIVFEKLNKKVLRGNSLSFSMNSMNGIFPELMINMFAAGEQTGSISKSAMEMSNYYAKEHKLNSKIKASMIYPGILMSLTLIVIVILFTFVIPRFVDLLGERKIPLITKILLGISSGIINYWYLIIAFIVLLIIVIKAFVKIPKVALKLDYLKLKVPIVGGLLTTIYTARFARTLSSLYGSGINVVEAVKSGSRTVGNKYLVQEFEKVSKKIVDGNSLSSSINNVFGIEDKLSSTILVGEETGQLDELLSSVAESYDFEADAAITKLVGLLEPVMIVSMTLIVGAVLMGVMLPMMSSYGSFLE